MKRTVKQVIGEALTLIWQDIKDYKGIWMTLTAFFIVQRTFFGASCSLVRLTGFPCPACGLTRAGIDVLRGDFYWAWRIHPFIYPIILLILIALTRRYILKRSNKVLWKGLIVLIIGLVIFYIYRMIRYFPGGQPISYYGENLFHKIFGLVRQ